MIQALVFDLDDTLYLESDFVASGYRAVAGYIAEKYQCRYRDVFYTMMTTFTNLGRDKVFPVVIERFLDATVSLVEFVEVYRNHDPQIRLFPGYAALLERLNKSLRLGIVTDGLPEVQRRKVAALGLPDLVHEIVYTWEYGSEKEKPHPFAFSLIADRLCVHPSKTLYVGDNPTKDQLGAEGAGMQFARVQSPAGCHNSGQCAGGGVFVIDSLYQLPHILQQAN
jgi:putative hydrolase of the HAD superfamily